MSEEDDPRPSDAQGRLLWEGDRCPHNDECEECTLGGELQLCDYCANVYHVDCLEIMGIDQITSKDNEHWMCPVCVLDDDRQ